MRLRSGVPGFDALTAGGLPRDRLYILSGPPGSGKTTFAVQFLTAGLADGERSLYVSMHETAPELRRAMAGFSFDFDRVLDSDRVNFLNVFDEESQTLLRPHREGDYRTDLRNQIRVITNFVEEYDLDRLVLDSTMLLRYFFSESSDTQIRFLTGLKRADATVLLISEMTDPSSYTDDHYLAHGLIFLHNFLDAKQSMQRGLQIVKMRGTAIDTDIHQLTISDEGVRVDPERLVDP